MRLIALDLGSKTIGVAASDELGWTHALQTIRRKSRTSDLEALAAIVEEREPERIVLGLPLNMDDSEGPAAERSRRFAEWLKERFELPVVLWDERLSTWEAEAMMREASVKRRKRRDLVDAIAAERILRSYLDAGAPEEGIP